MALQSPGACRVSCRASEMQPLRWVYPTHVVRIYYQSGIWGVPPNLVSALKSSQPMNQTDVSKSLATQIARQERHYALGYGDALRFNPPEPHLLRSPSYASGYRDCCTTEWDTNANDPVDCYIQLVHRTYKEYCPDR